MGYDCHLGEDGPRLIEVNTNAGGAFLNFFLAQAQRACCAEMGSIPTPTAPRFRRAQAPRRAYWPFGNIGDESNILVGCQGGDQIEELENESDMPPAIRREVSVAEGSQFNIFEKKLSARRVV